jgi:hypothetical protein
MFFVRFYRFPRFCTGCGVAGGGSGGPVGAGRWGRENEVKKKENEKKIVILKIRMERWDPKAHFGSHTWEVQMHRTLAIPVARRSTGPEKIPF